MTEIANTIAKNWELFLVLFGIAFIAIGCIVAAFQVFTKDVPKWSSAVGCWSALIGGGFVTVGLIPGNFFDRSEITIIVASLAVVFSSFVGSLLFVDFFESDDLVHTPEVRGKSRTVKKS